MISECECMLMFVWYIVFVCLSDMIVFVLWNVKLVIGLLVMWCVNVLIRYMVCWCVICVCGGRNLLVLVDGYVV